MSAPISRAAVVALLLVLPTTTGGAQTAPDSIRIERLAALGRLWSAIKYFHPALATQHIAWDSALVQAIPKVRVARSADEYADAVDGMLQALGDPATRVIRRTAGVQLASAGPVSTRWTDDSTLVIRIPDPGNDDEAAGRLRAAHADIQRASRVVFDLRSYGIQQPAGNVAYILGSSRTAGLLTAQPLAPPGVRTRMHSGLPPQTGGTSGGYWNGFSVQAGDVVLPADAKPRRTAFIVDSLSDVPPIAAALQRAGLGIIVAEGARRIVDRQNLWTLMLADSVQVNVRIGEFVDDEGISTFDPDTVISAGGGGDQALAAAVALLRSPPRRRPARASQQAFTPPPELAYAEMSYPSLEYRLLGAFRLWAAIEYFFPYKSLTGEDWNRVLSASIPRFEAAGDSLAYVLAVAEMAARTHDSHARVRSRTLRAFFGETPAPAMVQYVEGQPVIIQLSPDSSVQASGLRVGDIVMKVDGETAQARRARIEPYIASSTPQALDLMVAVFLLAGREGSTATLVVRGADNRDREVRIPRRMDLLAAMEWHRSGATWRILDGNIGYVDLEKLTVSQVDSMFDALAGTRAIIFDDRGYPQGTAWPIAPRLTNARGVAAARFERPLLMSPDTLQRSTFAFVQTLPATDKRRYLKPTVMLIDERAGSQAEHTGLFFESANGTKFIGSPTAGVNGDVTNVVLPGGVTVAFSGHDVRHADGRQLQRVGLQPHVLVRPTIAGIRAGRDEVLERAVAYIKTGR